MKSDENKRTFLSKKAKRFCPVIAVTACTDPSTNEIVLKSGMKLMINKPVEIKILRKTLIDYYFWN